MCKLFVHVSSNLWRCRTKSLRINGLVTSIRLEMFFWDILEELSFRDKITVNQIITNLYLESLDAEHDIGNFTAFLRVCCSRYLSLVADGAISREVESPLYDVDAEHIIEQEALRNKQRKALFSSDKLIINQFPS
ncbi:MAG: ribbon-helix-helix domain-containing protein [Alteromonadaceae bacterium]|jgi:predicted DNA-binding ribbon-helix-helix protein